MASSKVFCMESKLYFTTILAITHILTFDILYCQNIQIKHAILLLLLLLFQKKKGGESALIKASSISEWTQ